MRKRSLELPLTIERQSCHLLRWEDWLEDQIESEEGETGKLCFGHVTFEMPAR